MWSCRATYTAVIRRKEGGVNKRISRIPWTAALCAWLVSGCPAFAIWLDSEGTPVTANIIVIGLQQPTGLYYDPETDLIYVAEQGANRISAVKDREAVPIFEEALSMRHAPVFIYAEDPPPREEQKTHIVPILPSSVAFDERGYMYISEDNPEGGRILQIARLKTGHYVAREISTPYMHGEHGYTSMATDSHGRIFATARMASTNSIFSFGSGIMRDEENTWWMIDQGPFADFSNIAVSPGGDTVVLAEKRNADMSWYDTESQQMIASIDVLEGVRFVTLLYDGTTVAAIERADGNWGVVEIDPLARKMRDWAGDLREVGGITAHPTRREVFVSLKEEGKILRLMRPPEGEGSGISKLAELTHSYSLREALPPSDWPEFFKSFVEGLDLIRTVNHFEPRRNVMPGEARVPMTMQEFSEAVPVVAGLLKATLISPPEDEPDPIEQVCFVLFYPNKNTLADEKRAPNISLFAIRRKSGATRYSDFMTGAAGKLLREDMDIEEVPDIVVSFPSGYYSLKSAEAGHGQLRVFYLGLGMGPDYWMDVDRFEPSASSMIVEKRDEKRIEYALEPYPESVNAGRHTILVAGVAPRKTVWFELGKSAVRWNVITSGTPLPRFRHTMTIDDLKRSGMQLTKHHAQANKRVLDKDIAMLQRKIILHAATRWKKNNLLKPEPPSGE